MLQRELLTSSEVAIKVPVSHVYDTIRLCFDKQRYQQQNDGEYRAALKKIGLRTKTASVMNCIMTMCLDCSEPQYVWRNRPWTACM